MPSNETIINSRELSKMTGLSVPAIGKKVRAGELPGDAVLPKENDKSNYRFRYERLRPWIESLNGGKPVRLPRNSKKRKSPKRKAPAGYLTAKEAAEKMGTSQWSIHDWTKRGLIKAVEGYDQRIYSQEEVERAIKGRRNGEWGQLSKKEAGKWADSLIPAFPSDPPADPPADHPVELTPPDLKLDMGAEVALEHVEGVGYDSRFLLDVDGNLHELSFGAVTLLYRDCEQALMGERAAYDGPSSNGLRSIDEFVTAEMVMEADAETDSG